MTTDRQLFDTRFGKVYVKMVDKSSEQMILVIESNALKMFPFFIQPTEAGIPISGIYEDNAGSFTKRQNVAYTYPLPTDVDPKDVKIIESESEIRIVAQRRKRDTK